jgi:diguanylate cyclase (GGDEF)-like protein
LIAKNLFLSASTLVILFTAKVYLGPDFGFQTYLLIFIVMPYVAFSNKERFFSFFYSIANMIFFYYIQYGNYDFFMKTNSEFYESGIPHVFNVITTLTAFSTVIIIMIILNNIISANEKILKEALGKANYYADYDHLTGIYNRRKTSKILEEKCKSFLEEENFVVVMCDIDHFKKINDYYGHPAGDVIIKEVTEVIASKLRKHDALGRWGGEEFLIIISNINLNQGISLVEEIRREIEKKIFHLDIRVTMSFGLAEYSSDKNSQTIISEADNFMYFAKENGRNQIIYIFYRSRIEFFRVLQ